MSTDLNSDCPWQPIAEAQASNAAQRASIEAGLLLVEVWHHHAARRLRETELALAIDRMALAVDLATLRRDIVGAMQ